MKTAERQFTTISGVPIESFYGPHDLAGVDLARELPPPGEFPYTRLMLIGRNRRRPACAAAD
jgi:methylmalonyl-CoA mutase N-terminal domain/subunit